jgi:putative hydrolase of the HAD superfamily
VTLDFWSTIFGDAPGVEARRQRLRVERVAAVLASIAPAISAEELAAAHHAASAEHIRMHGEGRDMTFGTRLTLFLEHLRPGLSATLDDPTRAALADAYASPGLVVPPLPLVPDLPGVLAALRARGPRLALISNTGSTPGRVLREVMGRAGVLEYFEVLTFSDEVELAKPATAIFTRTLAALGVAPEAAVHVGDLPRFDIAGAHRAGMMAILVGDSKPLLPTDAEAPVDPAATPDARIATVAELPAALDTLIR